MIQSSADVQAKSNKVYYRVLALGASYTLVIKNNGTMWVWGNNKFHQYGIGEGKDSHVPIKSNPGKRWLTASAGSSHSLAIRSDGTLWGWGTNHDGQVGNNSTKNSPVPARIKSRIKWKAVAAGERHSLGIKSDGTLWAWGRNFFGQLGNNSTDNSLIPVKIGRDNKWIAVAAGANHSLGLKSDHTLWAWGYNSNGQLGSKSLIVPRKDPKPLIISRFPVRVGKDNDWIAISTRYYHCLALKSDGSLWGWGFNSRGQLGNNSTKKSFTPIRIGSDHDWTAIGTGHGHSIALKSNGTVWAWGLNRYGQVGNNSDDIEIHTPVRVGSDNSWIAIAAGAFHSLGVKSDGSLWTWGNNWHGKLGNNSTKEVHAPVCVFPK